MTRTDRIAICQELAQVIAPILTDFRRELTAEIKAELKAEQGKAIKTVTDIMRDFGYSRRVITSTPWLMPNWGKSDFPGRTKKWQHQTYLAWFAVSGDKRRKEWSEIPLKQKEAIKRGMK